MNDPMVVSISDDFRRFPRETWGTRDRVRAAREDRARAATARLKPLPGAWEPFLPQFSGSLGGWESDAEHRERQERQRLNARLRKHGIEPL